MITISNFYSGGVDSTEYSCYIYFNSPSLSADCQFSIKTNGVWTVVFPNEINPGEYYQRVFDLNNGDNQLQLRIDCLEESVTSDVIVVNVAGQIPEVTPPRTPTLPKINADNVEIMRRLACKVEYSVDSEDPVIQHWYSTDNGVTWDSIEPTYHSGKYSFTLYYIKPGSYKILLKVMDNYWDISNSKEVIITVKKGEGDEPGYNVSDTKEFVIRIDVPETPPPPEIPSVYYVINCGSYTDESIANSMKAILISKGYNNTLIEKTDI